MGKTLRIQSHLGPLPLTRKILEQLGTLTTDKNLKCLREEVSSAHPLKMDGAVPWLIKYPCSGF